MEQRSSIDISGKIQARFDNFVYLDHDRKDEYGVPEIQINFSYSETDLAVVHLMQESVRKVAAGMKASVPADNCIWPPGYDNHDAGTCRMGDDPETSVTNRYGQVHSTSGLYIADSSILPNIGCGKSPADKRGHSYPHGRSYRLPIPVGSFNI